MPSTRSIAIWLVLVAAPAFAAANEGSFNPAEFDARLQAEHFEGATGHEVTIRRIVSAVEDVNKGVVIVHGFTQVLDCKKPELLSTTRCDPCEYPLDEWVRRPLDVWFVEKTWHRGSSVMRARALRTVEHFNNYFNIRPMEGLEHRGMVHQFWRFDGRRPSPLEVRHPPPPEPPPGLDAEPPKEWDPVADVEIRYGDSQPERVTTAVGETSVRLTARAYTAREGQDGRRLTDDFWPFWASDCGSFSRRSGMDAKETVFRLEGNAEECNVHLYEARSGERRQLTVVRGKEPPPPVRVAITFEGGREGDGVVLSGTARFVQLEAHAYNPEGEEILGFQPEWSVDGGEAEFIDDSRTRARVHIRDGSRRAMVRARHRDTGAEATFEIRLAD
jgi:hypothetical protein